MGKYSPEPVTQQQQDDLVDLTVGWMELPDKDHMFAQSLLFQWKTKQWLSPKQWYWIAALAEKLPDRQAPDFTKGLKDELDELESLRVGKATFATTQIS
jgi:hypothetical protein